MRPIIAAAPLVAALCFATTTSVAAPSTEQAAPDGGHQATFIPAETAGIADSYIVFLNEDQARAADPVNIINEVREDGVDVTGEFPNLAAFAADLDQNELDALLADPRVDVIEQNFEVSLPEIQLQDVHDAEDTDVNPTNRVPWGVDRVDSRGTALDNSYTPPNKGEGVHAFVIDTGIVNHKEFTGRIGEGRDTIDKDSSPDDCHGHGTHVGGSIAGSTVGVAPGATIHGVRVLDCKGRGKSSDVIAGMDWVAGTSFRPAVANLSLGGGPSNQSDQAVKRMVRAGVTAVLAAGNDNKDACNSSPARTPEGLTVASSDKSDNKSSFSNHGKCVDIFAPGSQIYSAGYKGGYKTMSGTSMAAPHAAGGAALYLAANKNATPAQVSQALVGGAESGKLKNTRGTANKLLNVNFIGAAGQQATVPGAPAIAAPVVAF